MRHTWRDLPRVSTFADGSTRSQRAPCRRPTVEGRRVGLGASVSLHAARAAHGGALGAPRSATVSVVRFLWRPSNGDRFRSGRRRASTGYRVATAAVAASVAACAAIAGVEPPTPSDRPDPSGGTIETSDGVTITPAALVLPPTRCGENASGTIVLANNGSRPIPYTVSLPRSTTFSLRGASSGALAGTLEQGGFQLVSVDAVARSAGPQTADIVVKIGDTVRAVDATLDVRGATIALRPALVAFGELEPNRQSEPVTLELENVGTEQVSLSGFAGQSSDFVFSKPTLVVPAGARASVDVWMTPGSASDGRRALEIVPQVGGALCGDSPRFVLEGYRVDHGITVAPMALDFGRFDCGDAPSATMVVALNDGSGSPTASYSAKLLAASSRFRIVGGASGQIGASPSSSRAEIVVGVGAVGLPLGSVDEELQIDIVSPVEGSSTRIVKLHMAAHGAIIEASPTSLAGFSAGETKAFTLRNVGDARTCATYAIEPDQGFAAEAADVLDPGEEDDLRVRFTGGGPGPHRSRVDIVRVDCPTGPSAPLCVPAPTLSVTATR